MKKLTKFVGGALLLTAGYVAGKNEKKIKDFVKKNWNSAKEKAEQKSKKKDAEKVEKTKSDEDISFDPVDDKSAQSNDSK